MHEFVRPPPPNTLRMHTATFDHPDDRPRQISGSLEHHIWWYHSYATLSLGIKTLSIFSVPPLDRPRQLLSLRTNVTNQHASVATDGKNHYWAYWEQMLATSTFPTCWKDACFSWARCRPSSGPSDRGCCKINFNGEARTITGLLSRRLHNKQKRIVFPRKKRTTWWAIPSYCPNQWEYSQTPTHGRIS